MALGYGRGIRGWDCVGRYEKLRQQNFVVLKEYPNYLLCGKIKDGELLYRECFMRIDVEEIHNSVQPRRLILNTR